MNIIRLILSVVTIGILPIATMVAAEPIKLSHVDPIRPNNPKYIVSADCPQGTVKISVSANAVFLPVGSKAAIPPRVQFVQIDGVELDKVQLMKLEKLLENRTINFLQFVSCGLPNAPEIRALVGLNSLEVDKIGTEVFDFTIKNNEITVG